MRTLSRKSFAIGLLVALLVSYTGRAVPAFALADPVQAISPVFDTQIYQLSDYVDSLPEPSLDIFYILSGVLFVSQLGAEKYKLIDPYATKDGVINWFKSMGVRAYNSLIGLYPSVDPILGFDVRPYIKPLVAAMMGNAVMASNYSSVEEFMESEDQVLVPFKRDIQNSINVIWQLQGGPYHWQFETSPFTSNVHYQISTTASGALRESYAEIYNSFTQHVVRFNENINGLGNAVLSSSYFDTYHNIFINTANNTIGLCNDSGQYSPTINCAVLEFTNNGTSIGYNPSASLSNGNHVTYEPARYNKLVDLVQDYYDFNIYNRTYLNLYFEDFVTNVYAGTNWINKQEIFNINDLNIDDTGEPYYDTPDDDNVLIDIKNLIDDLVNETDIWNKIILNIVDPDGTINLPSFIRVSVDLTPITELMDPPIPVNLNDIAELTDNSYLERVKEEAQRGGNALAYLVAFWHNCDAELVYVLFGAGITILIGAFIGKWGHS